MIKALFGSLVNSLKGILVFDLSERFFAFLMKNSAKCVARSPGAEISVPFLC